MTEPTDKIRDIEIELFDLKIRNRTVSDEMTEIKTAKVIEIEVEWTETKDKDLSNQTKRNAVVDSFLDVNETYTALQEEKTVLEKDIALIGIDLDYIKRVERQKLSDVDMLPFTALGRIADALEAIAIKDEE